MKKIKIIIERNEDGFWGYAENEKAIVGGGTTVQECKQDILDCIETLQDLNQENKPAFLEKEYELIYKFDTASLLNYYKGIFTNSALERITGINQKQIPHYASGHRNPRAEQRMKIENALHTLGKELLAVEL
jgi:predicted RNase H-like HicB family nuclease